MGDFAEHHLMASDLLSEARTCVTNDPREAVRLAELALTEFVLCEDYEGQIHANHTLAWAASLVPNWPLGLECALKAFSLCRSVRLKQIEPLCVLQLGLFAMEAGVSELAVELCTYSQDLASRAGDSLVEMRSFTNCACAFDDLGRSQDAYDTNERGIQMCANYGGRSRWSVLYANRAIFKVNVICSEFKLGNEARVAELRASAESELFDAWLLTKSTGNRSSVMNVLVAKIELKRVLGKHVEMPATLDEGLSVAQALDLPSVWAKYYMVAAMYEKCCDRFFAAACLLEKSSLTLESAGIGRFAYQTHIDAAEAFDACGMRTKADTHRAKAVIADKLRRNEESVLKQQLEPVIVELRRSLSTAA